MESCEKNNTGTLIIHNSSTKGKLWLDIDESYGPGLSSADYEISVGQSIRVELPVGLHDIEGVWTTSLPGNGIQISGAEDKEVFVGQCDEVNVYYDL
jgi:hypothetical protein